MEESLSTAGEELKDMKKQLSTLEEEVEQARKQRDEVQSRYFSSFLPTAFFIIIPTFFLLKFETLVE